MIARVGPFEVSGALRAVPGARFLTARDPSGAALTLQVVFLRPDSEGEGGRAAEERRLTAATEALIDAGVGRVEAHGSTGLDDGRRLVWWRLAHEDPGAAVGALPAARWIEEAQGLLSRLVDRHRVGAHAPLLTEQALFVASDGLDWMGVPVAPSPTWAGTGAPPPRSAPDERDAPSVRGDLWRLGQALTAVAEPAGISTTWGRWLDGLRNGAFSSADEALAALPSKIAPPRVGSLATVRWGPPSGAGLAAAPDLELASPPRVPPRAEPSEPDLDFQTVTERALSVLAETPGSADARTTAEVTAVPRLVSAMSSEEQAAVEALAMSWSQPPLPTGESPWSDVEHAPLPEPEPDSGIHVAPLVPEPAPPKPGAVVPESGFAPRRVALGLLVLLIVFGTIALLVRRAPRASTLEPVHVARSSNVVRLETDPPGGRVIGRRDGRVIGGAPLEFLVPEGAAPRVLVALPGHEPAEITLPERGTVTVQLQPLDPDHDCDLEVRAESPFERWPSGDEVAASPGVLLELPGGSGIVRAPFGATQAGARILRCPALGGAPRVRLNLEPHLADRRVRVARPAGAHVTLDGRPLGPAPVEAVVRAAFVRVEVETLDARGERWVPISGATEIHVPLLERRAGRPLEVSAEEDAGLVAPSR